VLETSGKVAFDEERLRARARARHRPRRRGPGQAGDVVEKGATLLVIDSPDLSVAKADFAKAVADVERPEKAL
jgi:hypothetical protein